MERHVALAVIVVATAAVVYVGVKAWQRWRMSRLLAAATITIDELRERIGIEPLPYLIDVGSSLAQGARARIPGARLLDLDAIARGNDFPRDRDIVLYCACPNEASARRGAQLLLGKGYRRVRPLAGGIDAWVAAGHPVEGAVADSEAVETAVVAAVLDARADPLDSRGRGVEASL